MLPVRPCKDRMVRKATGSVAIAIASRSPGDGIFFDKAA